LKRALPSVGEEDSEEVSLVAILDGRELKSRAKEFRGGTMFAWFGGIDVDLTEAELAQGARIRANTLFGGVAIKIPPGWRVQSKAKALMGGVDAKGAPAEDYESPILTVEGMAVLGGIAVGASGEPGPADTSAGAAFEERDAGSA